MMRDLSLDNRLEANAIIDRLVDDGVDWFDPADGQRLVALIPCEGKARWFSASTVQDGGYRIPQRQAVGAGGGHLLEQAVAEGMTFNGRRFWRVGGYKVTHVPGEIEITTMLSQEGGCDPSCYLVYDSSLRPTALFLSSSRDIFLSLFWLRVGIRVITRSLWKRPLPERSSR